MVCTVNITKPKFRTKSARLVKKQRIIYSLEAPQLLNREKEREKKNNGHVDVQSQRGRSHNVEKWQSQSRCHGIAPLPKVQSPKSQTNSGRYPMDVVFRRVLGVWVNFSPTSEIIILLIICLHCNHNERNCERPHLLRPHLL